MRSAERLRQVPIRYGGSQVVAIGLRRPWGRDLYHDLLTASWWKLSGLVAVAYGAANALFATGYLALGDAIENARRGSFWDAFFFSVQTMATIGYGKMAPRTVAANVLVTVEALVGLLGLAVVTGLVFAKFSRPTARVRFSRVAVIAPFDGVPSLMFRMANARADQIAEAHLHVSLLRDETTREGESLRRMHDLRLRRGHTALFALTWTAVHPIDSKSPLHGETAVSLREKNVQIMVSFTGYDEAFSQTIHARHAFPSEDLVWGACFRDIFTNLPDGRRAIDYRRFDDVVPLAPGPWPPASG